MRIGLFNLRPSRLVGPDARESLTQLFREEKTCKVFKRDFGLKRTLSYWQNYIFLPFYIAKFLRFVKDQSKDLDVSIIYVFNPSLGFIGDLIKVMNKDRKVICFYEAASIPSLKEALYLLPRSFMFYISRIILNNKFLARFFCLKLCDKYIVTNSFQKDQLIKCGYKGQNI
jgi:hypothetical protein